MPQSVFGANLMNYAVSANVRMAAGTYPRNIHIDICIELRHTLVYILYGAGSARVCGRVGEFHGGFETMTTWEMPPGVCLTLHANGAPLS